MSDTRTLNETYAEIGQDLINSEEALEYIHGSQVSIAYLSSQHKKMASGKIVHAECEKVQDKYKWGIPADFTITVFEPNVRGFSEEQLRILLFHELLHIKIEYKDGEEKYSINPHDLEDFRYIIDRFGSHWDEVSDADPMEFTASVKVNVSDLIRQNLDHLEGLEKV